MSSDWRYFATRLNGDGTEDIVHPDLPLRGVSLRQVLSGPGTLDARISPAEPSMMTWDSTIFKSWSTALWAECDGQIRGGGILVQEPEMVGAELRLECVGFTAYPQDMPWTAPYLAYVDADPAQVIADVWGHMLNAPGGNLGLEVDVAYTAARVGSEEEPLELSWWATHDLNAVLEDMARSGPLDYIESHRWNDTGDGVAHALTYSPSIGRRRNDLRFVIGENIIGTPTFASGDLPYASEIIGLGAGEGESMLRASRSRGSGRLRRVTVIPDKSLTSQRQVGDMAAVELAARSHLWEIGEITVADHDNARVGSVSPGDEVFVDAGSDWSEGLADWHRVLAVEIRPDEPGAIKLSLVRV